MVVSVIKEFVDIHTGELHEKGSSFECDEARYRELTLAGTYVKKQEVAPVQLGKDKK